MNKFIDRTGEEKLNNFGSKMKIIRYASKRDIDVYFEKYNWIYYNSCYDVFKRGNIKCPYEPRVYKRGYIGEGNYKGSKDGKHTRCYDTWNKMLQRCYDEKYHNKYPSYKNCEVEEYLLNFQNFAKWYEENYYEIEGQRMELDKDILCKGNKIYSRENCIFVPRRINSLFVKKDANRGNSFIGTSPHNNGFRVCCNNSNGERVNLGTFKTKEEAFQIYKQYKEEVIKEVADEYKDKIPDKLYKALYRYEVEIND